MAAARVQGLLAVRGDDAHRRPLHKDLDAGLETCRALWGDWAANRPDLGTILLISNRF